jgi:quercetin 2,3-dioxygenase
MTASQTAPGTASVSPRRGITRVADTNVVLEGAGVPVRRALPSRTATYASVDPFLLLDHFRAEAEMMEGGFPPHPHRGFEIVTYLLAGAGSHSDNMGNSAVVQAGGLQRITAGRGMWHGEGPGGPPGPMEGLQLWINLPRSEKGIAPEYQGVEAAALPVRPVGDAQVKTLVGEGAPTTVRTPVVYYDVTVPAGGSAELPLPEDSQGFVYLLSGDGRFGDPGEAVTAGQLAVLGRSGALPFTAGADGVRFVVAAGTAIGEQPRWNGPYVD